MRRRFTANPAMSMANGRCGSNTVFQPYTLPKLQTVRVVIVCKVDNPRLAAVYAESLPEPPQGQVPLYGPPRYSRVPSVPAYFIVPGRLHVQVGVVESRLLEETADQRGPPLGVLHQEPVQVGHVQQGVGQTCQLCLLHRPAVSGSDDVDGGQDESLHETHPPPVNHNALDSASQSPNVHIQTLEDFYLHNLHKPGERCVELETAGSSKMASKMLSNNTKDHALCSTSNLSALALTPQTVSRLNPRYSRAAPPGRTHLLSNVHLLNTDPAKQEKSLRIQRTLSPCHAHFKRDDRSEEAGEVQTLTVDSSSTSLRVAFSFSSAAASSASELMRFHEINTLLRCGEASLDGARMSGIRSGAAQTEMMREERAFHLAKLAQMEEQGELSGLGPERQERGQDLVEQEEESNRMKSKLKMLLQGCKALETGGVPVVTC
ncbi:hypothetical protein EYF80_013061 [Liparis tanakae]|uniref:Uncharacterized protein n=1 Tax=Liparis tanakae TaxID=230148 RepID=A0A4Z2IEX7_9TELE|nr:hypothetical protein EYF80_013061 [Liparis tanakae]